MKPKKEMRISAIENGTVIDHISAGRTFKVMEILDLQNYTNVISVGVNLDSKRIGKKGLVKIAGRFLTPEEVNKIAIVSPEASLNIIKNFEVEKKLRLSVPEFIEGIVKCVNPVCITNREQAKTQFSVTSRHPLRIRCRFCEHVMGKEDIELL